MVEALVAIPLFVTIFALLLYVGSLYAQKQKTFREARERAWTYAMNNCSGSTQGVTVEGGGVGSVGDLPGQGTPGTGADPSVPNGDPTGAAALAMGGGMAVATSQGRADASFAVGGFGAKVATTTRVTCNEAPRNGDPATMIKYAWGSMKTF